MSTITQRGILRWKEWIPLVTQQQRLRSLIQVIAYNVHLKDEVLETTKVTNVAYYYTLHLSTMSSPLYTSEKLESENPKWAEIETEQQYGAANGIVIRLWATINGETDHSVTVWGLYFSGLVYLGPRLLCTDPSVLGPNSIVFHMHGGYFTAPHCFLNPTPATPRTLTIQLNASHVKPSYTVNLLLRLQTLQQTIKKQTIATSTLREQISAGCFAESEDDRMLKGRGSAVLRKLLSKPATPKAHPEKILALKKEIEMKKFRIQILTEQKDEKEAVVYQLAVAKDNLREQNSERDIYLMNNYYTLQKSVERGKEFKRQLLETKTQLSQTLTLLDIRRKTLMSELSIIYPIVQRADGSFTIREVCLPNAEDFDGKDELQISVALGFVVHLVQMMAYFLNVPTRYPMCHYSSRSKIVDHIKEDIADKDREFPLYARGKDKTLFDYGVFLLNKNIAQLRWCCGLTTSDLRATLPNLAALMHLKKKENELGAIMREWHTIRPEDKRAPMTYSLDRGLDCVADAPSDPSNSDPQEYSDTRRVRYDTAPVHDLASLMSLDITCKSYDNINGAHTLNYNKEQRLTISNENCCKPNL